MHLKVEKQPPFLTFVAYDSKINLNIFSTSLIRNLLFCEISCNFLIMMLITIKNTHNKKRKALAKMP